MANRPFDGRPERGGSRWLVVIPVALTLLAGCSTAFPPEAATVTGRDVNRLYEIVLIPVVVIFLLVTGLIVWSVVRYRRRDDTLPAQVHGDNRLEIAWTVLPTILVLAVFALSMETLGKVDAKAANPDLTVDVHGYQWYWEFDYPDAGVHVAGLGQRPELVLPVDRTVHLQLNSDNVIHSFYVPLFLFKRDVIPGVTNNFDVTITEAGTYRGQCAEFCGVGHADMTFDVRAVPESEFEAWLTDQAEPSATPTPAPSLAPDATTLEVSASNATSFDQSELAAPADEPFAIHFRNEEASTPHDVAIRDAGGKTLFQGEIITGPAEATYVVGPLPAGSYTFFCVVHPDMHGVLDVR